MSPFPFSIIRNVPFSVLLVGRDADGSMPRMSRDLFLLLPAPADLDTIRSCLSNYFELNPKVEGLGDAEELHVKQADGGGAIFETAPGVLVENIRGFREGSLPPGQFRAFHVRLFGRGNEDAVLFVADQLHGWLYDAWSRLWSADQYRAHWPSMWKE